jgi:RNA polymerase sigma factor (sigma-70 family)
MVSKRKATNSSLEPELLQKWEVLSLAFEQQWQELYRDIQIYVRQLGLAVNSNTAQSVAEEILNEVVERAFKTVARYDVSRPARPWLRQIAFYMVKERKRQVLRDSVVVPIAEVAKVKSAQAKSAEILSEDEMFGLIQETSCSAVEDCPSLEELLSLVQGRDQQILKLAFADGLRGKSLAAALGIREGAAYTGLSRALSRLREEYLRREQASGGDE